MAGSVKSESVEYYIFEVFFVCVTLLDLSNSIDLEPMLPFCVFSQRPSQLVIKNSSTKLTAISLTNLKSLIESLASY